TTPAPAAVQANLPDRPSSRGSSSRSRPSPQASSSRVAVSFDSVSRSALWKRPSSMAHPNRFSPQPRARRPWLLAPIVSFYRRARPFPQSRESASTPPSPTVEQLNCKPHPAWKRILWRWYAHLGEGSRRQGGSSNAGETEQHNTGRVVDRAGPGGG